MYKLLVGLALGLLLTSKAMAADYYVSPSGSDSNPGTIDRPFKTIAKGYSMASAGSTVYVRAGTYLISSPLRFNKNGSSGNLIKVFAYPNEVPVIDGINLTGKWGDGACIDIAGNYNHIKGFEVTRSNDFGVIISDGGHNIVEGLNVHHSSRTGVGGCGICVYGTVGDNLILNNDSHHNRAPDINSDGFVVGGSGAPNIFRGNRAWRNADDGYDTWDGSPAIFENNWAWENGYDDNLNRLGDGNGFKLGGSESRPDSGGHIMRNNVSWRNPLNGFDYNGATKAITLFNNTAFNNGPSMPGGESWGCNFLFVNNVQNILKNNISFNGCADVKGTIQNNSWNLPVTVNSADFLSMDDTAARGPRKADGSLPDVAFLRLASSSDLIDKGVNVGLTFAGVAPDLGAYEFNSSVTKPIEDPPPPPPPPQSTSVNLLQNAGFEDGSIYWNTWRNSTISSNNVYSGAKSVRVGYVNYSTEEGGRYQTVPGTAGATYSLSAYAKITSGVEDGCYIGIQFLNSAGTPLGEQSARVVATSYTLYSISTSAPAGTASIKAYIWKGAGYGKCFGDNFSLVRK